MDKLNTILRVASELEHIYQSEMDEMETTLAELQELRRDHEEKQATHNGGETELRNLSDAFRRILRLNYGGEAEVIYRTMIEAIYASGKQPRSIDNNTETTEF